MTLCYFVYCMYTYTCLYAHVSHMHTLSNVMSMPTLHVYRVWPHCVYVCVCVVIVYILQEIELSEALCGFRKVIHTLDHRELVISTHAGDVIKHGIIIYTTYEPHTSPYPLLHCVSIYLHFLCSRGCQSGPE